MIQALPTQYMHSLSTFHCQARSWNYTREVGFKLSVTLQKINALGKCDTNWRPHRRNAGIAYVRQDMGGAAPHGAGGGGYRSGGDSAGVHAGHNAAPAPDFGRAASTTCWVGHIIFCSNRVLHAQGSDAVMLRVGGLASAQSPRT